MDVFGRIVCDFMFTARSVVILSCDTSGSSLDFRKENSPSPRNPIVIGFFMGSRWLQRPSAGVVERLREEVNQDEAPAKHTQCLVRFTDPVISILFERS